MSCSPHPALCAPRVLPAPTRLFDGRAAIEAWADHLNRSSPVSRRQVGGWHAEGDQLALSAVLHGAASGAQQPTPVFMGEIQFSFTLEVAHTNPTAAPAVYAIGLPLDGRMQVQVEGRRVRAEAGEAIVIDPAQAVSSRLDGDTHFVEFYLPRAEVQRLAAEWSPGAPDGPPRFTPLVPRPQAQRLLFMAAQAAELLHRGDAGEGPRMLFRRWSEMMALTLLLEQPRSGAAASAMAGLAPAPARLRRAIDYIEAHAGSAIGLADIAEAAGLSVSTLLRLFGRHLGRTPHAHLRAVRLARARETLRSDAGQAIGDLALRWGFQNASKFSQAYLQAFGERPSQTRAHTRLRHSG